MNKKSSEDSKFKLNFTPEQIYNKNFSIVYKGYDAKEVDIFLDKIISDYNYYLQLIKKSTNESDVLRKEKNVLMKKIQLFENENLILKTNIQESSKKIYNNLDLIKRINRLELIVEKLLTKLKINDDL